MAKKSVKKTSQKRLMCTECKKPISRKLGVYVFLGTYNRPAKPDQESYFHFPCFIDWHNEKVQEKAFGIVGKEGIANITSLINDPELQKLASNLVKEFTPKKKVAKRKPAKKHDVKGKRSEKMAKAKVR